MENVYHEAVRILNSYLGPAAERFLGRQSRACLNKPAEELTGDDMDQLAECVRKVISPLVDDTQSVDELVRELLRLSTRHAEPIL